MDLVKLKQEKKVLIMDLNVLKQEKKSVNKSIMDLEVVSHNFSTQSDLFIFC